MRQAPIGIVGDGRLARHLSHYLKLLELPVYQWSRGADPNALFLSELFSECDKILLLINDSAIEPFILANPFLRTKKLIHCAAALDSKYAYCAHPLMTFSDQLYDFDFYKRVPFILTEPSVKLQDLLPGLPNPSFNITPEQQAYYHSLCVISGNFTTLLWQKCFNEFEQHLRLPPETALPYMHKIFDNLSIDPKQALTGPLARGDKQTIESNLRALNQDPYKQVYQAFIDAFHHEKLKETS